MPGQGLGGAVDELAEADTHYLNRAASLDDARTLLTQLLELQRRWIELPAALSEAERALADEISEENWEHLQETVRREQDSRAVDAEVPDYGKRSGTGGT